MLLIRKAQLETLREVPVGLWLAQALRRLYPDTLGDAPEPALEGFARASMSRAAAHGFGPDEYLAWAALEHALGESFATRSENAWAAALLADRARAPGARMQALREQAILRLAGMAESDQAAA